MKKKLILMEIKINNCFSFEFSLILYLITPVYLPNIKNKLKTYRHIIYIQV